MKQIKSLRELEEAILRLDYFYREKDGEKTEITLGAILSMKAFEVMTLIKEEKLFNEEQQSTSEVVEKVEEISSNETIEKPITEVNETTVEPLSEIVNEIVI